MSNTCGATAAPPDLGTAVIPVLMPPVDGYRHAVPWAFLAACSWYCQRIPTVGCQHGVPVHAVGAGHPAVAQLADAGCAMSTTGATMDTTNTRIVATDDVRRMGTSLHHLARDEYGRILLLSCSFCQ